MERQPLGKLAPAQPHGASSLRPAHLGPPPASDAAPVKRGRGRPPGAKNKKTLLLEAMMGGEPRNAFTPTPGSRPLDSALSAPLSAPSLSMPSWDSLGRASPSPVPTGVVPQTATRTPKPAPAPAIPVGTVVDRVAASALRQVSHRFVDLRDVVKRAREESAAVDEWRYGAMRRVDAAEEAAEDEATRRLRRNAALMAEVMTPVSNDGDDDSSKNDRSKVDSSREETLDTRVARLRAAVDVTSEDDDAVVQESSRAGDEAAFESLLARLDGAVTKKQIEAAKNAFAKRFPTIDPGSTAASNERATGAATLAKVEGGAELPAGWTASSISL